MELRKLTVTYSATVTHDYEPGTGDEVPTETGWYAPSWSLYTVSDDPAYADVERWTTDDDDPVSWLRALLVEHLGTVDGIERGTIYGAGQTTNMSGDSVTVVAHVTGFTEDEIIRAKPCGHYWTGQLGVECPVCGVELG